MCMEAGSAASSRQALLPWLLGPVMPCAHLCISRLSAASSVPCLWVFNEATVFSEPAACASLRSGRCITTGQRTPFPRTARLCRQSAGELTCTGTSSVRLLST